MTRFKSLPGLLLAGLLGACAGVLPPTQVSAPVADAWVAPLPHQGSVVALTQWWQRQGDPLLVELIAAAQVHSPSVAQALARIDAARANEATANAALLPGLGLQASASRGVSQPNVPLATTLQGGLQASWELDLVGANRAVSQAARSQVEGAQAQWHDARVSVAAEVAGLLHRLRSCQQQLVVLHRDADSRQQSARLSAVSAQAGFVAPSVAAMARASAAQASSQLTQQGVACAQAIQGLAALTAMPAPDVKQKMALDQTDQAQAATFEVASVPVQVISQRPDVFAAERDVVLASAQVGSAKAQQWPRLSLNGAIGSLRSRSAGESTSLSTWSFGPLALSLPLFDAGQRAAQVTAAQAAYQAAVVNYQSTVRHAVREVEEALLTLQSTQARATDVQVATQGYTESLAATQNRYDQGLASLIELEDARRNALAAESSVLDLALERQLAWVALYRAVGGGFEPPRPDVAR